jgi:hypothetical protein
MFTKAFHYVYAIISLTFLFLAGCGGASAPMGPAPTGAASVKVVWDGATEVPSGVAKLSVAITSPGTSTWMQSFPVSTWGGTASDVPAGTATVRVTALDSLNNAMYSGSVNNQVIKSGQTTAVETIVLQQVAPVTYTISGKVTRTDIGSGVSGTIVTLAGSVASTAQTDANGDYVFTDIPNGSYTVSASMGSYTMSASQPVVVNMANVTNVNFSAIPALPAIYAISGQVTFSGAGLSGVTVAATGSGLSNVQTDSNGNFTFTHVQNGSYNISATRSGYSIASQTVVVNSADAINLNFPAALSTSITLGTTLAEVLRIQGTPTVVQNYGTYSVYSYGTDNFTISNLSPAVTAWSNTNGTLKVNLPFVPKPGVLKISLGDSLDDVVRLHGTPTVIQNNGTSAVYYYGKDFFNISTPSNLVYTVNGWSNTFGTLQLAMRYGTTTGATSVSLGTSWDDMIKIQGTPTVLQNNGTSAIYYYGSDYYNVSTPANKVYTVTGWSNTKGTLKVTLPYSNQTTNKAIAIGSSLDDVAAIQKIPVAIRNYVTYANYYYGNDYYSISIPENKVIGWSNTNGILLVDMTIATVPTGVATFGLNSSLDDLITAQGTPVRIINNGTYAVYYYGTDFVNISIPGNKVYAWSNPKAVMKVHMTYDVTKTTSDTKIKLGTSLDDVIRIQGTPTILQNGASVLTLYYGTDYFTINVAVPGDTVYGWSNTGGTLKL